LIVLTGMVSEHAGGWVVAARDCTDEDEASRYRAWHVYGLGYLGLGPGGPLLFQFFAERYEEGSVLVSSNL
jgi:hypothetical protein